MDLQLQLKEIEDMAASAYAEAMYEIERIMVTDPRVCDIWDHKNQAMTTRSDIRDYLEDFAAGCKLPEHLAFLRYTPQSTFAMPEFYTGIKRSNELHRRWAYINDKVERYAERLRTVGTVVV